MKLRSFFYVLVAGATGLLLIAVAGFFWITSQSPLNWLQQGAMANPTAAIFVPKQAPAMVSLLVNPNRLEAFRQLVAPPLERRRSRAELNQIENSLLAGTDINYQRDIRPWLGDEVTLAVTSLDFDRNPANAAQPGYLLIVNAKDGERAREFLQLFYSNQAATTLEDVIFETYKGVNLIYRRPLSQSAASTTPALAGKPLPETLTAAVVGGRFVLFANHPKVLRDAINNVQAANLNLEDDPEYQQMLKTLNESMRTDSQPLPYRIGLSFVHLPSLAAWASKQPAPVRESFKGSETIAVALSLNRQGVLAQTALLGSESTDTQREPTLSQPVDALQYIPAQSALAIAGTNLNQFWTQLTSGTGSDDTLKPLLEQAVASLQSRWGIQLPEEIFSWVQGEYALSMMPRPDRANPDWIFVAQKADDAAEASIEHLDTVARSRGLSVGALPLGEKSITAWTKLVTTATPVAGKDNRLMKLEAQVFGVHTSIGNYEIFTTSLEAMNQALKGLENSLLQSEDFKTAIAPLPQSNDGYLYLDWKRGGMFIERQLPIVRVAQLVAKPLFDHLRSLSVSGYGIENGVQRSQLFFRLDDSDAA
jgi:hypothetical protein